MGNIHLGGTALKPLVILGATGSIGRQAIEVAHRVGVPIAALAANSASDSLLEMGVAHPEAIVCVANPQGSEERFRSVLGARVRFGAQTVVEIASLSGTTVLNGIVGAAGLKASLSALGAGNRLALANKESLVAGGSLLTRALAAGGGELIPVDSEHSAIWQCVHGESVSDVARLILTASGGPFRGRSRAELDAVTVAEALAHPTWAMGPRITTDSATLMNKAFEVIEAHHLFGVGYDDIDVVIHPQSIVHSFVEFDDGVAKAELGFPDMRKPIQAAITYPERVSVSHQRFDLVGTDLTFEAPDFETFPCLALGYEAGRRGGTATAVLNAADEIAVEAFLTGRIAFLKIAEVVGEVLGAHDVYEPDSVAGVDAADAWARAYATAAVQRFSS